MENYSEKELQKIKKKLANVWTYEEAPKAWDGIIDFLSGNKEAQHNEELIGDFGEKWLSDFVEGHGGVKRAEKYIKNDHKGVVEELGKALAERNKSSEDVGGVGEGKEDWNKVIEGNGLNDLSADISEDKFKGFSDGPSVDISHLSEDQKIKIEESWGKAAEELGLMSEDEFKRRSDESGKPQRKPQDDSEPSLSDNLASLGFVEPAEPSEDIGILAAFKKSGNQIIEPSEGGEEAPDKELVVKSFDKMRAAQAEISPSEESAGRIFLNINDPKFIENAENILNDREIAAIALATATCNQPEITKGEFEKAFGQVDVLDEELLGDVASKVISQAEVSKYNSTGVESIGYDIKSFVERASKTPPIDPVIKTPQTPPPPVGEYATYRPANEESRAEYAKMAQSQPLANGEPAKYVEIRPENEPNVIISGCVADGSSLEIEYNDKPKIIKTEIDKSGQKTQYVQPVSPLKDFARSVNKETGEITIANGANKFKMSQDEGVITYDTSEFTGADKELVRKTQINGAEINITFDKNGEIGNKVDIIKGEVELGTIIFKDKSGVDKTVDEKGNIVDLVKAVEVPIVKEVNAQVENAFDEVDVVKGSSVEVEKKDDAVKEPEHDAKIEAENDGAGKSGAEAKIEPEAKETPKAGKESLRKILEMKNKENKTKGNFRGKNPKKSHDPDDARPKKNKENNASKGRSKFREAQSKKSHQPHDIRLEGGNAKGSVR